MAELFVGSAVVAGSASQLWSYNRENFMWDKQNQQNRDFQAQNLMMGRFGLFREDIRDLANLTTSKMDSYLIVNTLKLGFIVTIFFNFDRTDQPAELSPHERAVVLFFTSCFLTSFFCLLTSIWFSMHATVVAQSFMTKMLVQTVRIPFPSVEEVDEAAPMAQDFETAIDTAFRMPLFAKASTTSQQPQPTTSQFLGGRLGPQRETTSGSEDSRPKRSASSPLGWGPATHWNTPGVSAAAASRDVSLIAMGPNEGEKRFTPRLATSSRPVFGAALGMSSNDIGLEDEDFEPEGDGTLPHLKLYSLLMAHWQPFDLYSKVTMSIGTSTMLSGIAYYGLFYARMDLDPENPHFSGDAVLILKASFDGWLIFMIMSVLAWWCVTFDLFFEKRIHYVFVAALGLSSPLIFCVIVLSGRAALVGVVLAFTCQALWICFLNVTALTWNDELPAMWRASLYLNVLRKTGFGSTFEGDKDAADLMGKGLAAASSRAMGNGGLSVSNGSSSVTNNGVSASGHLNSSEGLGRVGILPVHQQRKEAFARGGRALCRPAVLLLKCLDIVLMPNDREPDLPEDVRIKVQAARDQLHEAAKAAGVLREIAPGGPAEGFLLIVPMEDGQEYPRLINPQPAEFGDGSLGFGGAVASPFSHGGPDVDNNGGGMPRRFVSAPHGLGSSASSAPLARPRMSAPDAIRRISSANISVAELITNNAGSAKASRLGELMQKTKVITKALIDFSSAWTPKDAQGLESYGGRAYTSPDSFAAQFRSKGKDSKRGIGSKARRFYRAGVVFLVLAWLVGIIACFFTAKMECKSCLVRPLLRSRVMPVHVLSYRSAPLPQPWFSPTTIACDATGNHLAFSDGIRAFVLNQTTAAWAGPLSACGSDAAAIAFDDRSGLLAALGASIVRLESVEVSAGVPHATCDVPHSAETPLEAFALESSPRGPLGTAGLAIRGDGILLALEAEPQSAKAKRRGVPRVAGTFGVAPDGQRLVDVSVLGGKSWALNDKGAVLELDISTGNWTGRLWQLQSGYHWLGLCALAGDGESAERWLALGRPIRRSLGLTVPAPELWHFGLGTVGSEPSTLASDGVASPAS